jgi:hypothetical protein
MAERFADSMLTDQALLALKHKQEAERLRGICDVLQLLMPKIQAYDVKLHPLVEQVREAVRLVIIEGTALKTSYTSIFLSSSD